MGGNLPLGYDLPAAGTRTLLVNEVEAVTVRQIFSRYLELGSVHALQRELESEGIVSKLRIYATGLTSGGQPFSRGALFHLLRNKIYLGQIVHKDQVFEGEHDAIVEPELFEAVQARLDAQARRHRSTAEQRATKAPLTGKLFDAAGAPMSPTTSRGKTGRSYRYYVSAPLQQGAKSADLYRVERLAAPTIERIISEAIGQWMPGVQELFEIVRSVHLCERGLQIELGGTSMAHLAARLADDEMILDRSPNSVSILLPIRFSVNGGRQVIAAAAPPPPQPDPVLILQVGSARSNPARANCPANAPSDTHRQKRLQSAETAFGESGRIGPPKLLERALRRPERASECRSSAGFSGGKKSTQYQ